MRKWKCIATRFPKDFTVGRIYVTSNDGKGLVGNDGFCYRTLNPSTDFVETKFEEVFDKKEEIMKFDIKKDKIAVLCNTKEKVEKLCEVLGENMFKNFRVAYPKSCYVGYDWLWSDCVGKLTYDSYNYFTNKTKKYKLITFEEFMRQKEEDKMEFKVGDKVEILGGTKQKGWCSDGSMKKYIGTKGIIVNDKPKYEIKCDLDNDFWFFNKEDLKLVSNVQPQQFTITVSDSITTLETNGKKVEIKRYHTDKHDVEFAMQEVVNKYFEGVRKEERDAKLPKVGDRVRVVDNDRTYNFFKEWLIQNNASIESVIKWKSGEYPKNNDKYTIKMIVGTHVLIEDENNAYIIGVEGLEVVK